MIHDSYCPYRKCHQVFNGEDIEAGEAYCEEDSHPCDQENGRCRMTIGLEAFLSDEKNLEEIEDAD